MIRLANKSGIVMVMVLLVVIVIMVFSVTIFSQSLNQNNFSQDQIDQIKAEQLAKGVFWNSYYSGNFTERTIPLGDVGGKSYTAVLSPSSAGPLATQGYNITVSYVSHRDAQDGQAP